MKIDEIKIFERRVAAAKLSKGISSNVIIENVIRLIHSRCRGGSVIDYGAGTGTFLARLHALRIFDSLAGVDILTKPNTLPESIDWHERDLNNWFEVGKTFDLCVSTEVIEHLENPRLTVRNMKRLLKPGGQLILTTPNQESIRSYCALIFGGHYAGFLGQSYPAHITALLRMDLRRIAEEEGFYNVGFSYTNSGGLPKLPSVKWQEISFNLLRGRLFSDNLIMVANLPAE
jgi:2-polyprenyl-3-methyl-5-hydroxy-6-metoxy-1,4-benzoquinol methylase